MLGLLDAQSAGAVIPPFVKTRFNNLLTTQMNTNGTWDYQADGAQGSGGSMSRVGVSMQGMAFMGITAPDPRITATETYITQNWTTQVGPYDYYCHTGGTPSVFNKGCGYAMFNIFKGLKYYGVATLPGIGRPAGGASGFDGTPADDWYADYVDNLLSNQHSPTSATGGGWDVNNPPYMSFSGYGNSPTASTALAELILSPVAFVLPDAALFASVGLSETTDTNLVNTDHTVTASAQSSSNQGVPGATINFVVSGTNAGATGTCAPVNCTTGADGKVSFTYHDTNGLGNDTIQAFIGSLGSNSVTKHWIAAAPIRCDANNDKVINQADLLIIRNANGQAASGPSDPRDGNGDGVINVADVRYCQLRLTPNPQ
jgi:hypothetical protein